jgi:hypothetical protein
MISRVHQSPRTGDGPTCLSLSWRDPSGTGFGGLLHRPVLGHTWKGGCGGLHVRNRLTAPARPAAGAPDEEAATRPAACLDGAAIRVLCKGTYTRCMPLSTVSAELALHLVTGTGMKAAG